MVNCVISLQSLLHMRNEARLSEINVGSVNANNFADVVPSIHLANVEKKLKLGVFLIELGRNILVALHLQQQACNFLKFKLKMIGT